MKIRPIGDRVVVRPARPADRTASGLHIPDNAQEKSQRGEVLAVGEGLPLNDGRRLTPLVKAGDVVLFAKYGGVELRDDNLVVLREGDILGVVEG